jgi:phosphatidylinositol-3,4,5-trisphosphate 3-phosphatase/dual-specificity protein phosphatase PTEN
MALVRGLVSKKKVRFVEDGFDLDLTYITPRIIAMGAPFEGNAGLYRNPLPEVQRFFETRHKGNYRIYDLRAEKGAAYDPALFGGSAVGYRFFDHNPCPLATIAACCADMAVYLAADPAHVVALHCKAGKGRTGLMIAAYFVHSGAASSTTAALKAFGDVRTHDGKGVTIPSQMRYVHYYEASLQRPFPPSTYTLRHVRMHTVPNFDLGGGCDPYFDVRLGDGRQCIFNWYEAHGKKVPNYQARHKVVDFDASPFNVRVRGDVKVSPSCLRIDARVCV